MKAFGSTKIKIADFMRAMEESSGNYREIAKILGVGRSTAWEYANKSAFSTKIQKRLKKIQTLGKLDLVEAAKKTLLATVEDTEDTKNSLKAAIYILDNLGKDDGFGKYQKQQENAYSYERFYQEMVSDRSSKKD